MQEPKSNVARPKFAKWVILLSAVPLLFLIISSGTRVAASMLPSDLTPRVFLPALGFASSSPSGGTAHYVDGNNGNDSNPGTSTLPWKTVQKATSSIKPGDTVIIASGIYRIAKPPLVFGPAGVDANTITTFQAAPAARVIFTDPTDLPIQIILNDYVRVTGLWFGGITPNPSTYIISLGGQPIGRGKQVVNCTVFGYNTGIFSGNAEYMLIQNNRFVDNSTDKYSAALYLSSGSPSNGSLTQHVIADHNIIIGGAGYGLQAWHGPRDLIISRNFIAGHQWGSATDGNDSLFANNFYWKETGSSTLPPFGPLVGTYPNTFLNNIFGLHGWVNIGNASNTYPHLTFANNAFTNEPWPQGIGGNWCKAGCGKRAVTLAQGQELQQLGITALTLDSAILALHNSFSKPVATILADQTIELNFAKIQALQIPSTSPLYRTGVPWTGLPTNIGPDAPAPANFWAAFRALGLNEWDRFGKRLSPPPTPSP